MSAQAKPVPNVEDVTTRAFLRAASALGLKNGAIASVLGVSASTVSRLNKPGGVLSSKQGEWDRATTFIRIYRSLAGLLGGDLPAMSAWLNSHNHDLGNVPLAIIQGSGSGLYNVIAYLDYYRGRF
jgi:hypothetical protein